MSLYSLMTNVSSHHQDKLFEIIAIHSQVIKIRHMHVEFLLVWAFCEMTEKVLHGRKSIKSGNSTRKGAVLEDSRGQCRIKLSPDGGSNATIRTSDAVKPRRRI